MQGLTKEMKNYGLTSVSEFLGDMLVYRNLKPMDGRLPGLQEILVELGLETGSVPRKSEADYAQVMAYLLRAARSLEEGPMPLQRLIYVGDTRLNDGTAFANLCHAGGWSGAAFIGSENQQPAALERVIEGERILFVSNRWGMLAEFDARCRAHEFPIDAATAVILDLDKTTLGARGRNDRVINEARLEAVRQTVEILLGDDFRTEQFETSYEVLNQTDFHPFTTDNQDYLAYLCLILGSDITSLTAVVDDIRSGKLNRFTDFLELVEARSADLSRRLHDLHEDIYGRVKAGDPTPFKAFRYNEYRTTVGRMGHMPPDTPLSSLLAQEILITQEVREIALEWRSRGALLFGLSDKPDEASIPTSSLADEGYLPIHRTLAHAVGDSLVERA